MRPFEEDYETDSIEKCSRALSKLDDRSKIRVIRYLLDKFDLIAQTDSQSKEIINQNIQYQQNNLVFAEPKEGNGVRSSVNSLLPTFTGNVQLKDVLIKGLTKSEPEIILIACYINSNLGTDSFLRQSILDTLREHKVYSDSRRKSLSLNLISLTKKLYISRLTDEELMITELGVEAASNILSGNSTTKKRRPRPRKTKLSKQTTGESEDITTELDD